jgi:DNA-binding NarL/FixJ family response regulator
MSVRVLVVDDQSLVRSGFRLVLEASGDVDVVGEAGDGEQALALAAELRPDVVLMDLRMPVMDGLEATRRLLAAPDGPRVLVLTTFDLDEHVYDAMKAGASGFLLKDVRPEQLVAAVRAVHEGEVLLSPALTRRLVEQYVERSRPGTPPVGLESLTERERDVLVRVGRGLSNAEIACDLYVSEATVKTHVNHLLAKTGLRDRAQAVVLAYESGLLRAGDRPQPLR